MNSLHDQLAKVPWLLGAHVKLTFLALLLGIGVSLPLGILCSRGSRAGKLVLALVSVLQTIPGLALLALMVALLSSFGFWPALLALFIYSMLPILRNTVTGIDNVDAGVLEAAAGLGMAPLERLIRVELPLAAPVIVAGIRTSAVWVVGTATLSTPVGQPSLGNFIFTGLQTRNFTAVLVGCVSAAVLALLIDAVLALIERALQHQKQRRALGWAGATTLALAFGSIVPQRLASDARPPEQKTAAAATPGTAQGAAPHSDAIKVGSKAFTEQYVLSAALAQLLQRRGLKVDLRESLGSTVAFDALRHDRLDVYVDYSGTLWSNVLGHKGTAAPWRVLDEVCGELSARFQVRCLGPLGFENAYAFAMRSDRAKELAISSLADLAQKGSELKFGTDLEFLDRPEWKSVEQTYGLKFRATVPFDPTFMYDAVFKRDVDVITAFSSDARIEALGLTVLGDPRRALPPYDAVLLLGPSSAGDERVERALWPMVRHIDVALMRKANLLVDRDLDKKTPEQAATWLLGELPQR